MRQLLRIPIRSFTQSRTFAKKMPALESFRLGYQVASHVRKRDLITTCPMLLPRGRPPSHHSQAVQNLEDATPPTISHHRSEDLSLPVRRQLRNKTLPPASTSHDSAIVSHDQALGSHEPVLDIASRGQTRPLPEDSTEAKELYRQLVSSAPSDVLELLLADHERMNKVHFALAMKSLFRVARDMEAEELEEFKCSLLQHRGFQVLCAMLASKGPYYEGEVAADMLRFMCLLGLDSNHPAVQVYLQLIKYHLNDLHLEILVRLCYTMTRLTVTSQTQVIIKAIRVLVNHRGRQVPALNAWQLATLLEQCGQVLEEEVLTSVLQQLLHTPDEISVRLSAVLLQGLARAEPERFVNEPLKSLAHSLVAFCTGRIHQSFSTLDDHERHSSRLRTEKLEENHESSIAQEGGNANDYRLSDRGGSYDIMNDEMRESTQLTNDRLLSVIESCCQLGVYDPDLFAAIGHHVSKSGADEVDILLPLALRFLEQDFVHEQLKLDMKNALSDKFTVGRLDYDQVKDALHVLAVTSSPEEVLGHSQMSRHTSHPAAFLSAAVSDTWEHYAQEEQQQLLLDLAVLGETDLIEKLRHSFTLAEPKEDLKQVFPSHLHLMYILARLCHGNQTSDIGDDCHPPGEMADLGQALKVALGTSTGVQHGILSPGGLLIDHLLYLDEQDRITVLSGYKPADGHQAVAVLSLHNSGYHRNTNQLKGPLLLYGRLLQEEGFLPVFINYDQWKRMEEEDMLPYLARRICNASSDQHLNTL